MPKINLPELEALAEYMTGKVPRYGMFSTLKGLIDNSPRDVMTAQEWNGLLKPGQIATRAGVDFPLKKEELDYSGIPNFLANFKPNEKISRDNLLGEYMRNAPNFRAQIQSRAAMEGNTPEQLVAARSGSPNLAERIEAREPMHSDYSHAARGDSPDNARSPFGIKKYQVSVTKGTPEQIGSYHSHFSPQDISWSRTNQLPMDLYDPKNPNSYQGRLMRLIDEIQSDRHQAAIERTWTGMSDENEQRVNTLLGELAGEHGANDVYSVWQGNTRNLANRDLILNDPRFKEAKQLAATGYTKKGYAPAGTQERLKTLEAQIRGFPEIPEVPVFRQGEMNIEAEPNLQRQLRNLQEEMSRLEGMVPDTPFKTTQGFVGMEMRKALNDALQVGDQSLGLASGNDQAAFYQRRFNSDQTKGQNYNYNVTYPSVMRDLARLYGLKFGPQTVHLQAQPRGRSNWPLFQMSRALGDDPALHTFDNFTEYLNRPDLSNDNRRRAISNLFENMNEKFTGEDQDALGLRSYTEDGDQHIPGNNYDKFWEHTDEMSRANQKQQDMLWNTDTDEERAAAMNSPEHAAHQAAYDDAQTKAVQMLKPIFEYYSNKYAPTVNDTGIRQKTFENAIDLTDHDLVTRARAAGVPVWERGGSVDFDHIAHALNRIGRASGGGIFAPSSGWSPPGLTGGEDRMAGGGKISVTEHIVQLVSDFINHMHEVNRLPPEEVTEDHYNKAQDLIGRLNDQGIDPQGLIDQFMQRVGKGPGMPVTEHAEGGEVEREPGESSLTWLSRKLGESPILGQDLKRLGTGIAKQFYGLDKEGNVVAGGRAWTEHQGGTPMGLLDQITSTPAGIISIGNILKNTTTGMALRKMGADPEMADKIIQIAMPDIEPPKWSTDAGERLAALDKKVGETTGVGEPHGFVEHAEDALAGLVTPIPMSRAGKEAEALGHVVNPMRTAMEAVMPVRPALRRLPVDASLMGGLGTLPEMLAHHGAQRATNAPAGGGGGDNVLEEAALNRDNEELARQLADQERGAPEDTSVGKDIQKEVGEPAFQAYLNDQQKERLGMADGGQTQQQEPQPEAPTEESLLNDMLQRRILMRQSSPPVPMPQAQMPSLLQGGGRVGFAERLLQLLQKLTSEPGMEAHAADIASRNWSQGVQPTDIFKQVASQSPEMAEHAADIKNRNWTSIYDEPTPTGGPVKPELAEGGRPSGGKVEGNVDVSKDWADIRRRLAILQNPTIVGKPPSLIPPLPERLTSEDAVNAAKRQQSKMYIDSAVGQQMPDMYMQDMMHAMHGMGRATNADIQDYMDMLRAKILAGKPLYPEGKDPYTLSAPETPKGKITVEEDKPEEADTADQTMAEGGRTSRRGFLGALAAIAGAAKLNPERLSELEKSILGTSKEEAPQMTKETTTQLPPPAEGMSRRYIPVLTDHPNDDISGWLAPEGGPTYWDPETTKVLRSEYLGPDPHGQHMHRVLIEAPNHDMLENHLGEVEEHGTHSPTDPEWAKVWETHPDDVPGGAHPIHKAIQGIKDEVFGPADENQVDWERVGRWMDTIPESNAKMELDAHLDNLRDLMMSGDEEISGSATDFHRALDDLAAHHGVPMGRDPNR